MKTLSQQPTSIKMLKITYNGENCPVRWTNAATGTVITMSFDSQGRRFDKKVTVAGTVTLHHRYIYRGYLQIAALDLTRSAHPALWFVTWDPSQPTATRPLAIQKDGTWFTYGYDLTKNICEVFGPAGYIRTAYSYAPFGGVTAPDNGVVQPFQWSSEHYDSEIDLVYYNFRHYSPSLGRFLSRDPIEEQGGLNLYAIVRNMILFESDVLGEIESCSKFSKCRPKKDNPKCWEGRDYFQNTSVETPGSNGCGSKFSQYIVPDSPWFMFLLLDFSFPCDRHDVCYGTCGSIKSGCDSAFEADMRLQCSLSYRGIFRRH